MVAKKVLRTVELVCWCVGLALVVLYFSLRIDGELERRAAISSFMAAAASMTTLAAAPTPAKTRPPLTYGVPDQTHWSQGRIRAYAKARGRAKAGLPVAVLRIRRLGLAVPVYAADTARNMNRGAVLVAGTAAPDTRGNTAIAAHRDGYFRVLKNVVVGDVLSVQTLTKVERYRVTSLEVVKPTNISVLRQTQVPVVTLVTCYPFYFVGSAPRRFIVRAVALLDSTNAKQTSFHRRCSGPGCVSRPRSGTFVPGTTQPSHQG